MTCTLILIGSLYINTCQIERLQATKAPWQDDYTCTIHMNTGDMVRYGGTCEDLIEKIRKETK